MPEVNNAFVILMGMGTVFVGLICLVFLCTATSALINLLPKDNAEAGKAAAPAPSKPASAAPIADRQAIIAASCAVIAEELGEDVKNIKVVSFKRM